jgi:hypothetical protein
MSFINGHIFENLLKFHDSVWRDCYFRSKSWEKKVGKIKEKSGTMLIRVRKKKKKRRRRKRRREK